MISKNISDLKDINFEISTALQFQPSLLCILRSAISCCPVQQAVVVGCDITRSRGSIWKRHEEVIQGSFEGFRGDAALH